MLAAALAGLFQAQRLKRLARLARLRGTGAIESERTATLGRAVRHDIGVGIAALRCMGCGP